jgi:hypothetical protein
MGKRHAILVLLGKHGCLFKLLNLMYLDKNQHFVDWLGIETRRICVQVVSHWGNLLAGIPSQRETGLDAGPLAKPCIQPDNPSLPSSLRLLRRFGGC